MQVTWNNTQDAAGNAVREFACTTAEGRLITGSVWLPETTNGTVVCFGHGASGDRYQWPIPQLANRLRAEAGVVGLALDGPMHGKRQYDEGQPRENFAKALFSGEPVAEQMVDDWRIALDVVETELNFNVEQLGYFGLSMGTLLGLPFIGHEHRLSAAVIGLAGTADNFPGSEQLKAAASHLSAPVLFLFNLEDENFSRTMYMDLYDAIGSTDKRIHANPGTHNFLPDDECDSAFSFLSHHLGHCGDRTYSNIVDANSSSNA